MFHSPPTNRAIWRYMDLSKLLALLESESLYFCRCDLLGDPFEYAIPRASREAWAEDFDRSQSEAISKLDPTLSETERDSKIVEIIANFNRPREFIRTAHTTQSVAFFVNCWHVNELESAAMWKLYLKSEEGIAVRSTVGRLRKSLEVCPENIHIGTVKYIDYDNDYVNHGNVFSYILHKRKSFSHEQELRAVIWKHDIVDAENKPAGLNAKISINDLIDKIYVAPSTAKWLTDLVQSVVRRYGLDVEVVRSGLLDPPA